jgi:nucleotide-binding universal stress UspA family protein
VRDAAPFEAWADGRAPLEVLLATAPGRACEAAAGLVRRLAEAGGVTLTALHSYGAFEARWRYGIAPSTPEPAVTALLERDLRAWLSDHGLAEARVWLAGATEQAGRHVARLARTSGAGLVVAGLGAFGHGSVPHHLIDEAGLSVALVPEHAQPTTLGPRHIRLALVPTDLRADGWAALAEAYAAVEPGGRVHVIHLHAGESADPDFEARMRAWTEHVAPDAARGVTLTWSSEPGASVATGIAQAAERLGADLVCLATRARPGLRGLWAGSVARELVGRLHRPLLVCPVE